jgi:hypothetical protein
MSGIVELDQLLASISPQLFDDDYVFCTVPGSLGEYVHLDPIATFVEAEGLTLVLLKEVAEAEKIEFESVFKKITLSVHSSLDAVGLTAAVAEKLTSKGISANVIAAFYHDHIFVPREKASQALDALKEFQPR